MDEARRIASNIAKLPNYLAAILRPRLGAVPIEGDLGHESSQKAPSTLGSSNHTVRRAQRTSIGTVNHGYHGNPTSREQHIQEPRPRIAGCQHLSRRGASQNRVPKPRHRRRSIGGMHPYKSQPTGTSPGLVNASGVGVNAYGLVVRAGYEQDFWFLGVQIEGQFIFANEEGNTTVNLHAFDGTTFCEVRGTAVFAPNQTRLKIPGDLSAWPNSVMTKEKAAE